MNQPRAERAQAPDMSRTRAARLARRRTLSRGIRVIRHAAPRSPFVGMERDNDRTELRPVQSGEPERELTLGSPMTSCRR